MILTLNFLTIVLKVLNRSDIRKKEMSEHSTVIGCDYSIEVLSVDFYKWWNNLNIWSFEESKSYQSDSSECGLWMHAFSAVACMNME